MRVEVVDGNALAGVLGGVLADDPTVLEAECGACGAVALLATTVVERDGFADIVRCRGCTHTLLTVLHETRGLRIVVGALRSWVVRSRVSRTLRG